MKLKKILVGALITVSALVLCTVPNDKNEYEMGTNIAYADTEYTSGLWGYEKYSDGTVGITAYSGFEENLSIPTYLDGLKVTRIEDNAFRCNENIRVVIIPSTITYIGYQAFAGSGLTSVTIPKSVTNWGIYSWGALPYEVADDIYYEDKNAAFAQCQNLKKVIVECENIPTAAFAYCSNLQEVVLGSEVKAINNYAFVENKKLEVCKVQSNLTQIGDYAFRKCSVLKNINLGNECKYIGYQAFAGSGLTNVTIPKSVTNWGIYSWGALPYEVADDIYYEDKNAAFAQCQNLKKVIVECENIPTAAFAYCSNLQEVILESEVKVINNYAFVENKKLAVCKVQTNLIKIGDYAFRKCSNLKKFNLGNECEYIGYQAFAGSGLTSITIPNSVMNWAVHSWGALPYEVADDIYYEDKNAAFAQCYFLEDVRVGKDVKIYDYLFYDSNKINIYCASGSSAFWYAKNNGMSYTLYNPISATSIKTQRSAYTLVQGDTIQLYPILSPQNTTDRITWTSGNSDIATINEKNIVEAKSTGLVAFKGTTTSGKTCSFTVNVVSSGTTTYDTEPVKDITLAKLDGLKNMQYTGSAITPNVSVLFNPCTELIPNVDYTISFTNNKNIGTATVKVTGKGKYTGTITKTFKIVPSTVGSLKQKTSYSTTSITMSWKKVSNATGYEVYRATSKKGKYTKVKTTTSTTYKQGKLTRGKTYYYKVRAYKTVNGSKIYGSFSSVKAMGTKPQTPSITLIAGNRKAKVVWKKISGVSGYEIYMSTSSKGVYNKIKTSGSKNTAYLKTGLTKGKSYYFKVRAYRTVGGKKIYSSWSSVKSIKVK